jgi:hypothetical protein
MAKQETIGNRWGQEKPPVIKPPKKPSKPTTKK